jgi:hypothetical protein
MNLIDVTRLYFVNYPKYRQMFQTKPADINHIRCQVTTRQLSVYDRPRYRNRVFLSGRCDLRLTSSNRFQNSFGSLGEVAGEYSHNHVQKGAQQYVQSAATLNRQEGKLSAINTRDCMTAHYGVVFCLNN